MIKRQKIKLPQALDLHGLSTQGAFNKTLMFLKLHFMHGSDNCKIITGASGIMHKDFFFWMETPVMKPYVKNVKRGHETGAYLVRLTRKK